LPRGEEAPQRPLPNGGALQTLLAGLALVPDEQVLPRDLRVAEMRDDLLRVAVLLDAEAHLDVLAVLSHRPGVKAPLRVELQAALRVVQRPGRSRRPADGHYVHHVAGGEAGLPRGAARIHVADDDLAVLGPEARPQLLLTGPVLQAPAGDGLVA